MKHTDQHKFTPEQIGAFLDGQLTEPERRDIEQHLKLCPQCRDLLTELTLVDTAVQKTDRVSAPEGYFETFGSAVANRIARQKLAPKKQARTLNWGWITAAAALASLGLVLISGDLTKPRLYRIVPEEARTGRPELPVRSESPIVAETKAPAPARRSKSKEASPELTLAEAPVEMKAKDEAPAKRSKQMAVSGSSKSNRTADVLGSGFASAPAPVSIAPSPDRPASVENVTVIVICLPDGDKYCPEPKVTSAIQISLGGN